MQQVMTVGVIHHHKYVIIDIILKKHCFSDSFTLITAEIELLPNKYNTNSWKPVT